MAFYNSIFMAFFLLLSLFITSSLALDMSIIDYEQKQHFATDTQIMTLFQTWLVKHGKNYNALGDQKQKRFEIFKDNFRFIEAHNSISGRTYKLGLNKFADLTNEEYKKMYVGTRFDMDKKKNKNQLKTERYLFNEGEELPTSVDWRKEGAIVAVKDQGSCGSCWAFSAVCAVEGINQIVTGDLISLSEQELVDCDTSSEGCAGGYMDNAFQFIIKNDGIDTEENYPYQGVDNNACNAALPRVVTIDGFEDVPRNDEKSLKKAVAHQPVSVAIDPDSQEFQFYTSGVFTGSCGTNIGHGVVAVGYGTENDIDYWIVRNSWGPEWGDHGYIKMERNLKNTTTGKCGIAMCASYPTKTALKPGPSLLDSI